MVITKKICISTVMFITLPGFNFKKKSIFTTEVLLMKTWWDIFKLLKLFHLLLLYCLIQLVIISKSADIYFTSAFGYLSKSPLQFTVKTNLLSPEVKLFNDQFAQFSLREREKVDNFIDTSQKLITSKMFLEEKIIHHHLSGQIQCI